MTQPAHISAAPDAPEATLNGNRKLIRPRLPISAVVPRKSAAGAPNGNGIAPHKPAPNSQNGNVAAPRARRNPIRLQSESSLAEPSHAEVFYYQKQVQAQTPMVVVLDDGEQLEGIIEWFDKDALKLRLTTLQRILIYKSAIKFIYKTGENNTAG